MPGKKFTGKVVANPFKSKNVGRRTGKDMKAGKNIRKTSGGFDNFDDYWSESEAERTREGTFVKSGTPAINSIEKDSSVNIPAAPGRQLEPVPPAQPVLVQSQIGNIEPLKNALNPFKNKQIGRRTGKNMKAGKNIRIVDGGFENFDDYWSESDADSIASFSTTSSRATRVKRSSRPSNQENSTVTEKVSPRKTHSYTDGCGKEADVKNNGNDQETVGEASHQEVNTDEQHSKRTEIQVRTVVIQDVETEGLVIGNAASETDGQEDGETCEGGNKEEMDTEDSSEERDEAEDSSREDNDRQEDIAEHERQQDGVGRKGRVSVYGQEDITERERQQDGVGRKGRVSIYGQEDIIEHKRQQDGVGRKGRISIYGSESDELASRAGLHSDSPAGKFSSSETSSVSADEVLPSVARRQSDKSAGKQSISFLETHSSQSSSHISGRFQAKTLSGHVKPANPQTCVEEAMISQSQVTHPGKTSSLGFDKEQIASSGEDNNPSICEGEPCQKETTSEEQKSPHSLEQIPVVSEENVDDPKQNSRTKQTGFPDSSQFHQQSTTSQMNGTVSPLATSHKSSVYLSIVDDATGSITRLNSNFTLSPETRLFGTRRRLSYADSPGKDPEPKAKMDRQTSRSRIPQRTGKINKKLGSSPIPEDQRENFMDLEKEHMRSALQPAEKDSRKVQPATADNTKRHRLSSEQSQNLSSETGMFLSLVSYHQNKTSVSAPSSVSNSDDEFEILDEKKVYRARKGSRRPNRLSDVNEVCERTEDIHRVRKIPKGNIGPSDTKGEKGSKKITKAQPKKTNKRNTVQETSENPSVSDDMERGASFIGSEKKKLAKQTRSDNKSSVLSLNSKDMEPGTQSAQKQTERKTVKRRHTKVQGENQETSSSKVKQTRTKVKDNFGKGNQSTTSAVENDKVSLREKDKTVVKRKSNTINTESPSAVHPVISDISGTEELSSQKNTKLSRKSTSRSRSTRTSEVIKDAAATQPESVGPNTTAYSKTSAKCRPVQKAKRKTGGTRQHNNDEGVADSASEAEQDVAVNKRKTRDKSSTQNATEQKENQAQHTADEESEQQVVSAGRGHRKRKGTSVQRATAAKKSQVSEVSQLGTGNDMEFEDVEQICTPTAHCLSDIESSDSALKSGLSFRHFSQVPSSLKVRRSQQLMHDSMKDVEDDIISSPQLAKRFSLSGEASPGPQRRKPAGTPGTTTCSSLTNRVRKDHTKSKGKRRVTISDNVTCHCPSPQDFAGTDCDTSALPSMSATPVHYHQLSSPVQPVQDHGDMNKIVHPHESTAGLRRSQRTRVKPLEWYKNERIIYDRRKSGPVIVAVKPSRERLYVEQENLKRRRRRQKFLMKKKQQSPKGRLTRRLSTHVPVPTNLNVTKSTDIPVVHPDTQEEVLMSCFNPAAGVPAIGPHGDDPSPSDPFSLRLITQQNLFTTGVLTLAPASEKPLQRTISTAVLYFITYGKILVTINRATTVLQTGDHFFVPKGTVYKLRNLRNEEASLSFANLMVDMSEESSSEQPD